jgi:hypothetical protein
MKPAPGLENFPVVPSDELTDVGTILDAGTVAGAVSGTGEGSMALHAFVVMPHGMRDGTPPEPDRARLEVAARG